MAFQLVVGSDEVSVSRLHTEFHIADGHRPRIENDFAVADLEILKMAKAESVQISE